MTHKTLTKLEREFKKQNYYNVDKKNYIKKLSSKKFQNDDDGDGWKKFYVWLWWKW